MEDHDKDDDRLHRIRHSLAHVLAQAVLELRPGSTLGFGPPIDDGFYYDFILSEPLTEDDFPALEKKMKHIIKLGQKFEREELPKADALARIDEMGEPYKREYAQELIEKKGLDQLTFYRNGPFLDMCDGPHVDSTRELPKGAFKLRSVAGAYWRGDSDNAMMTRIYAWAFESKEQLVNALYRQCKAELMDALLRDFAFDATPREQHRAFFHRMVGFFRARPEVFDFLELHHHQPYLDADNLARERQALAPVLAFFAHGRSAQLTRAMPAEALAAIVWGAFSGLMKAARLGHLEADDALWAQAESCAWNAVRRGDPANETPKEPEP